MVDKTLIRGGIYIAKLTPVKRDEVGKTRPVIILNTQVILDLIPPIVFVCPLSSKSLEMFNDLHYKLNARDNLLIESYALIEHCKAISIQRIIHPRLAQTTQKELDNLLCVLQSLVGFKAFN